MLTDTLPGQDPHLPAGCSERKISQAADGRASYRLDYGPRVAEPTREGPLTETYRDWDILVTIRPNHPRVPFHALLTSPKGVLNSASASTEASVRKMAREEIDRRVLGEAAPPVRFRPEEYDPAWRDRDALVEEARGTDREGKV